MLKRKITGRTRKSNTPSQPEVAAWVELALSRTSYIPAQSPPGASIQRGLPSLQLEAAGPHPGDLVGPGGTC